MTIRYTCAECGAVLNIKDDLAGTQGHCPRCQVEFTVPAADASPVAEKEPATVGGEPAVRERERSASGFNEDDIGDILAAGGPGSSMAEPRPSENAFDEETEEEEEPRPKKKGKAGKPTAKSDSEESASIAKNLMARGEHAAVRDEKKAGRPFGGAEGRGEERPDYTARDIVKYVAAIGWPAVAGGVVFIGVCWWIMTSLMPGVKLPPLAPVTGTVTLDGKPLENAIVRFQPVTEGPNQNLNLATSFGVTDKDGKYALTYLVIDEKRIPGAVVGKHLVVIQATDKLGVELLPLHYSNTSKSILRKEIVKGGPPIDFALTSSEEPPAQ